MASTRFVTMTPRVLGPLRLSVFLVTCLLPVPAMAADPSPAVHPVDLKPEIQGTMFQGTIEAIDRASLSLVIKTDFGRRLSLLLHDPKAISGLHEGDRVRLEADGQGVLTVKKLIPHDVPLTQDAKPSGRST